MVHFTVTLVVTEYGSDVMKVDTFSIPWFPFSHDFMDPVMMIALKGGDTVMRIEGLC